MEKAVFDEVERKEGEGIVMEIFQEVAVIGDAVSEHDRVVHRLACLSDAYDMLVTVLKAQSETVLTEMGNLY